MAVFSVTDRESVAAYIREIAEQNEHIMALIAVGSGSFGYIDELSDIDMVIALDDDDNMATVMDYVSSRLGERLEFIYFKQIPQRRLQVYVSDSYLEIDIGYGDYKYAAAMRKNWRVLFDKTGTVDEAMRRSWEQISNSPDDEGYDRQLAECSDVVWHHFMHCAAAIKRGKPWRAAAELERARNMYIELLGRRYSLDINRGRETDDLPEDELTVLKRTLAAELTPETLWASLAVLIDAVYSELEHFGERSQITVNRAQVTEYVNHCRNIRNARE